MKRKREWREKGRFWLEEFPIHIFPSRKMHKIRYYYIASENSYKFSYFPETVSSKKRLPPLLIFKRAHTSTLFILANGTKNEGR